MTVSPSHVDPGSAERLAVRTLDLVNVASVSGDETAILASIGTALPEGFDVADQGDAVLFAIPSARREDVPFVVLAGHVDTVPPNGNFPGTREGDSIIGRGAADMKGALAVMLEAAAWLTADPGVSDLDVGLLFFGREELPITQSALLPLFDRCPAARSIDLAIVMEPTANAIELGCLGNLNARISVRGTAAHTARPGLGRNAIHTAIGALAPIADLPPRDVEIEGLVFREVMSVTSIEGGIAGNVVPDRLQASVNFRYAPTRSPAEEEQRMRELISFGDIELTVIGNAPPGRVAVGNPLVERLRSAGDLSVGPKQAWTPVAEFATVGVDAINLGPGDPQYAHRDDERIDTSALVRSFEVLRGFLAAREES
ncbi:MAG: succinyl-diaminopimelate desuccinylase [Actinomycetota bacterium]